MARYQVIVEVPDWKPVGDVCAHFFTKANEGLWQHLSDRVVGVVRLEREK